MNKIATIGLSTLAVVVLNSGSALASGGGSSDTWPTAYPLPLQPGTLLSQSATTAVVRSTDRVATVQAKLDDAYVTRMGCTRRLAVNKPRDYLCLNRATGKQDEVMFTFAALDPTASDPSVSQTNAFYTRG
jgi:hypothetical protein